jgi:hypothetical protein
MLAGWLAGMIRQKIPPVQWDGDETATTRGREDANEGT